MRHVKRALLWVLTATVPMVIAACYGVMGMFTARGWCVDRDSRRGIAGIEIRARDSQQAIRFTASSESGGAFDLSLDPSVATVDFVDVDGAENGGPYAPRSFDATSVPQYVEMAPES